MAKVEQLLSSCLIDIVIPDRVIALPRREDLNVGNAWLGLIEDAGAREKAFFDEKLDVYLTLRFKYSDVSTESKNPGLNAAAPAPPNFLLSFLNHLQVIIDAAYISSAPQESSLAARPGLPPRTSSTGLTPKAANLPLSGAPPLTPSPVPSANESDKKYVYSEGVPLKSLVWGEEQKDDTEDFRFLWAGKEKSWLAIYKLNLAVVYIRTPFKSPLLCLTASVTLRHTPLPSTPQRRLLTELLKMAGPLLPLSDVLPSKDTTNPGKEQISIQRTDGGLLEEVNLLDGLPINLIGSESGEGLYLPSTRLGPSARRQYSLPPVYPASPTVAVPTPSSALPVLRKSFRKTLGTASGFHVRMRPVMIPHLIYQSEAENEVESIDDESTVILSIEIENPGDSESGFAVENVTVFIKDEEAKIKLIPWGVDNLEEQKSVFPILMRSREQYYLLYAITFLKSPNTDNLNAPFSDQDRLNIYDRIVSIHITGRPFTLLDEEIQTQAKDLSYHTAPFLSKWNCRLDLDPQGRALAPPIDSIQHDTGVTALPVPASPFPTAHPRTPYSDSAAQLAATADNTKRHTFAGTTASTLAPPPRPSSLALSPLGSPGRLSPNLPGPIKRKFSPQPSPLGSVPASPPLPPLPGTPGAFSAGPSFTQSPPTTSSGMNIGLGLGIPHTPGPPPRTPAFPAYGNMPITPRPGSVTPSFSFSQNTSLGSEIDMRRERSVSAGVATLGSSLSGRTLAQGWQGPPVGDQYGSQLPFGATMPDSAGKDFAVSIRLIPPDVPDGETQAKDKNELIAPFRRRRRLIHPLDEFSLEIFVFNQSQYVRTLEVTLPDTRHRSNEIDSNTVQSSKTMWKQEPPAFMPLQSKIRIGPLGPSTCQSVAMRFLALTAGIHTIDGLVLTDLDTGDSTRLKSIMDFAVLSHTN